MAQPGDKIWFRRDDTNWREVIHVVNADGSIHVNAHNDIGEIVGGHTATPATDEADRKVNGRWWPR